MSTHILNFMFSRVEHEKYFITLGPGVNLFLNNSRFGMLGSVDSNTGSPDLGWDTDQFPMDIKNCALVMKVGKHRQCIILALSLENLLFAQLISAFIFAA